MVLIATATFLATSTELPSLKYHAKGILASSSEKGLGPFINYSEAGKGRLTHMLKTCMAQICSLPGPFFLLIGCIVVRIFLFWLIVRTTQCSTVGVEVSPS